MHAAGRGWVGVGVWMRRAALQAAGCKAVGRKGAGFKAARMQAARVQARLRGWLQGCKAAGLHAEVQAAGMQAAGVLAAS